MRTSRAVAVVLLLATISGAFAQEKKPKAKKPWWEEANHDSYNGFAVSEAVVLPEREVRPSLWFRADGVAAMRGKRYSDAHAAKLWDAIESDKLVLGELPAMPKAEDDKETIHKYHGAMSQKASLHAFLYAMADPGPERDRHAAMAKAALLRAYDGPLYEIDPKEPSTAADEIYRGTWAQSWCMAYDWVHETLTPEEDAAIRARLLKEARYMSENLFDWAKNPHNHLSKPAWGLGTFALTFSNEPEAKTWLAQCLKASNRNTRYYFSKDGIYREGSQYYIFSMINWVPFLYHYQSVSGVDLWDAFQPAMEWPILIRDDRGIMPNIEDSFIRPYPGEMAARAYRGKKTRLSKDGDLAGVLQWTLANTDYGVFEKTEKETGFNYVGASWDYHNALNEYLCYDPTITAMAPDTTPSVRLGDGGQIAFRKDWSYRDPGARFLLFQGVAECDNHYHFDHLSYIMQAGLTTMASDAGYTRSGYRDPQRKEWYLTAAAHNVVTLDGEPPIDFAESKAPTDRYVSFAPFTQYAEKEAAYGKGGRQQRGILFAGMDHFVVFDNVFAPAGSEAPAVALHFHPGRATTHTVNGPHAVATYEKDEYGDPTAALDSWLLSTGSATVEELKGEITYVKGDWAEFPYLKATVNGAEVAFLHIHVPRVNGVAAPDFENQGSEEFAGAALSFETAREHYLAQTKSVARTVGSLTTDATFAGLRVDANGDGWLFLREGTFATFGEKMLIKSAEPITLVARLAGGAIVEGERLDKTAAALEPAEADAAVSRQEKMP